MKIIRCFPFAALVLFLTCSAFFIKPDLNRDGKKKQILKILCYNIHHASPPSKPDSIDLDAIARVIDAQDPDLVALQEVDVFTRRSGAFTGPTT